MELKESGEAAKLGKKAIYKNKKKGTAEAQINIDLIFPFISNINIFISSPTRNNA
jgi:hypothetical protein